MNGPETSLENRLLALEARVVALEGMTAARPEQAERAEAFAQEVSKSHLNFRVDMLSLIEDHIEVLKLIHNLVGPADRFKNKQVLTYISRAEAKLAQFQAQFAELESRHPRLQAPVPEKSVPQTSETSMFTKPRTWLWPLALARLVRPATAWWNA